jgi:glycosyltransferase involved in cell wall biosynthesis
MLLSREAITKIGVFDDVNFKVGYGEENDWCWRAINNGFVNVVATNVYISHQHGVSFSKIQNLSSIRSHNLKALTYKHPNYFTDVAKYDSKNNLSNTYSLLKFVLEFEYFRIIKKPVKLFIGNYDLNENSEYSEICLRIFDFKFTITCNDFLINKTTTFIREKNSLSHILHLLNPENIKIVDDEYFNILELTNTCEQLKKTLVTIEIPYFDNILSGGISRMQNLIFELPKYTNTSGGIRESLKFLDKFPNGFSVSARFQKLLNNLSPDFNNWTIGLPDSSFPKCDVCITYSDNPYLSDLIKLPQINKILLYMLSYGMAIERERANVLSKNVTVMCSTKKLEKLISEEGVEVHRVGFALNMKEMYLDANINRKKYIAIMYHNSPDKKYDFAVKIADNLYKRNKIDGVITFGTDADYNSSIKPIGLIKHYSNANRDEIREIFNSCICFIMPSISEGLNLTPVESTLCGCPAVICDGAIDELFFDNETCLISNFNFNDVKEKSELILNNFNVYSEKFRKNMKEIVDTYTWDNVIQNMIKLI